VTSSLLPALRRELHRLGDPEAARDARRYMKSAMPFHGVSAVPFRAACRRVFAGCDLSSAGRWRREVLGLWRGARFREERHAAVELSGDRRARGYQTLAALPIYEEMIVSGAWWDFVDPIAKHRLGPLLRKCPGAMRRRMLAWSRSADMWKRRSAILCQLGFGRDTDLELLYACIEPSLSSPEFFLRKAIGWALRQYAWVDPGEVVRYVRAHEKALAGLSRREALKNVRGATSGEGRSSGRRARGRPGRARSRKR
jgi:3-methyladenine DNA glycosylase AlkD